MNEREIVAAMLSGYAFAKEERRILERLLLPESERIRSLEAELAETKKRTTIGKYALAEEYKARAEKAEAEWHGWERRFDARTEETKKLQAELAELLRIRSAHGTQTCETVQAEVEQLNRRLDYLRQDAAVRVREMLGEQTGSLEDGGRESDPKTGAPEALIGPGCGPSIPIIPPANPAAPCPYCGHHPRNCVCPPPETERDAETEKPRCVQCGKTLIMRGTRKGQCPDACRSRR